MYKIYNLILRIKNTKYACVTIKYKSKFKWNFISKIKLKFVKIVKNTEIIKMKYQKMYVCIRILTWNENI